MRVALIEDDSDIAFPVEMSLEREGWSVEHFTSGQEGLLAVQRGGFDFLILDLNLPDLDGFTICREVRRDPRTRDLPILMLTARIAERDRVTGLELGADDYLTKPFSTLELIARMNAVSRRARGYGDDDEIYEASGLKVDWSTRQVFINGEEAKLARKELELLWLLIRSRPAVVTRERILNEIWQVAEDVETRTVDAHIRNIRKKVGKEWISTVIGCGYRFEENPERPTES